MSMVMNPDDGWVRFQYLFDIIVKSPVKCFLHGSGTVPAYAPAVFLFAL
jgi:hypothetical protein